VASLATSITFSTKSLLSHYSILHHSNSPIYAPCPLMAYLISLEILIL
jgi:hypothetical protein